MASIIMGLIMGGLGGPAIAWAMQMPNPVKGHQLRREKFLAGKGPDPDKAPFGPHKTFKQNAVIFGLMFGATGVCSGTLAS